MPEQSPGPASIGVIAENLILGEALDGWYVKEFIEVDDEKTDQEVFELGPLGVSDWLPAKIPDGEHRIDEHVISTSVIQFNKMRGDGTEYTCVFTQVFKKNTRADSEDSERLQGSGFTITHTVRWQDGRLEYFSEKVGAMVGQTEAGSGAVRHPALWLPVPGGG